MRVSDGPLLWGRRDPGRVAIVLGGRRVTYGKLRQRVNAVAAGVEDLLGPDSGAPVSFVARDGVDFLCAFLGIVEAGAVAAPFAASWTPEEIQLASNACRPALHIAGDPPPAPVRHVSLAALLASGESRAPRSQGRDSGNAFYIGFSSGSSCAPKPIVRTHRAWLLSFLAMTAEFGVGPAARVAVPGSLFFSFSLIAALHALYLGGALHLPAGPEFRHVLPLLEGEGITAYMVPSLLAEVLRAAERRALRFPAVHAIVSAGEKLHPDTRDGAGKVFPGAGVYEYYGASELGYVTVTTPQDAEREAGSVGRPFLGADVRVLDETGVVAPPGEAGILCARTEYGSVTAAEHYSWPTAGDLARIDEGGFVHLAGRRDNMLVIRGENVFPEEVEAVIVSIAGVRAAAVVPEPRGDPMHLVALVITGGPLAASTIIDVCKSRLSARKVPRRVVFVERLPVTATGKLARQDLPALLTGEAGTPAAPGDVKP